MQTLGIDLGTTNTVAAMGSHVFAIRGDERRIMPSVVAFLPNGHVEIGEAARRRRAIDPENTISSSKRIIGRRWGDWETQSFRRLHPCRLVEDPPGWPSFETRVGAVSPTRVAATILDAVRERAGSFPDEFAVNVTVPTTFTPAQRQATAEAVERAGLRNANIVDEPLATAHAYLSMPRSIERAVVYDLGGGTFDCAVIACGSGRPEVVAHAGDSFLGGDDMDQRLATWVAREVLKRCGWDLANYTEVHGRLLARCEAAKIELSHREETVVHLSQVDPECPLAEEGVVVTRDLLDDLCRDLVRRSFVTCDLVLHEAGVRPADVDAVFLAGGVTHMPMIQSGVRSYFGRRALLEFEPTEVVALGASLAKS